MTSNTAFEIFLVGTPGLESALWQEVRALGWKRAKLIKGGVSVMGDWPDVWRLNLKVRGTSRILARFAAFRALHLAQLDKRARRVPWSDILRTDVPFRVEATCTKSRIYHSGAAAQRIERAIVETLGAPADRNADLVIKARIDDDLCLLAVDTSGEPLHKRGHKEEINKAPMRETLAALFLRQCGYEGTEPVLDPMCGSGTFVIEAAEIAAGLDPGRTRHFAFEHLSTFDPSAWASLKADTSPRPTSLRFYGSDHDPGAIRMSLANAARAGVSALTDVRELDVDEITPPDGAPGLVIVNPPYGDRIGDKSGLQSLYRRLGHTLLHRFSGWRVGLITNDTALADATRLPFARPSPPILHGGLRVHLFQTGPLP